MHGHLSISLHTEIYQFFFTFTIFHHISTSRFSFPRHREQRCAKLENSNTFWGHTFRVSYFFFFSFLRGILDSKDIRKMVGKINRILEERSKEWESKLQLCFWILFLRFLLLRNDFWKLIKCWKECCHVFVFSKIIIIGR